MSTDIFKAAEIGNISQVRACLANGVDVNSMNERGETALMVASRNDHKELVKFLMWRNSDLRRENYDGKNFLDIAVDNKCKSVLEIFPSLNTTEESTSEAIAEAIESPTASQPPISPN